MILVKVLAYVLLASSLVSAATLIYFRKTNEDRLRSNRIEHWGYLTFSAFSIVIFALTLKWVNLSAVGQPAVYASPAWHFLGAIASLALFSFFNLSTAVRLALKK